MTVEAMYGVDARQRHCTISPERWLTERQHRQEASREMGRYHHCTRCGDIGCAHLLASLTLLGLLGALLLLALALLEEGLGDEDLVLGGNGAVRVSIVRPHKCENSAECKNCSYSATFSTEG